MFHKGANTESHNAAILLIKPSTVYARDLSPFGCFTVLRLFRSAVKWGEKTQEQRSCLGPGKSVQRAQGRGGG